VVPTTSTSDNLLEKTMQDEDTDHEHFNSSSSSNTSSSSSLKIHRPLDSTFTSTEKSTNKALQWRKERGGADIKKIKSAIDKILWKECAFLFSRSRGDYCKGDEIRQSFDQLCRLFNIQLVLLEPHIMTLTSYEESLKHHLVVDERKTLKEIDAQGLWVVFEDYFDDWFATKNAKGMDTASGRGYYLYQAYRKIRNSILKEWERIFWRPSPIVTASALLWHDPTLPKTNAYRIVCPSRIFQPDHIFGMSTADADKFDTSNIPTILDKVTGVSYNPFVHFIRRSFQFLKDILENIRDLTHVLPADMESPKVPLSKPVTLHALIGNGPFNKLLESIHAWLSLAKKSSNAIGIKKVEEKFTDFCHFLETTEMHIFIAAWTLWESVGHKYFVDILRRFSTLAQFQMLLTEDFLGTFYMVIVISNNLIRFPIKFFVLLVINLGSVFRRH